MRRDPGTIWRSAPNFVVLVRPGSDVVTVAGPAATLWGLLAEDTTFEEVTDELARRHAAPPDVVREDLRPLWERLVNEGFIRG